MEARRNCRASRGTAVHAALLSELTVGRGLSRATRDGLGGGAATRVYQEPS